MALETLIQGRIISIPTLDEDVKLQLRACGEPICLFGEGPGDRRSRLRNILIRKTPTEEDLALQREIVEQNSSTVKEEAKPKETVYTRASHELIAARQFIFSYSIEKCKERLERQRKEETDMDYLRSHELQTKALWDQYSNLFVESSQFGADRPISCCDLNSGNPEIASDLLLTGCFGGEVRLWNVDTTDRLYSWKAHDGRVCCVSWSPTSTLHLDHGVLANQSSAPVFATSSLDKTAKLWSIVDDHPHLVHTLSGHINRVSAVAFHPSGRFVGTVSLDSSFRLWDVETGNQLLLQDGHARDVMGLSFQRDGSLAATCDQSGVCRLWDLRSGRSALVLQGHAKGMLCCRFAPNGFQLATGSDDNTIKMWDLRRQRAVYTVPAHGNVIPDLRFDGTGEFLVSGGFDRAVKVWSTRNFQCVKTLEGHDGSVTGVDFLTNKTGVVSCSHDKTWKKWSCDVF